MKSFSEAKKLAAWVECNHSHLKMNLETASIFLNYLKMNHSKIMVDQNQNLFMGHKAETGAVYESVTIKRVICYVLNYSDSLLEKACLKQDIFQIQQYSRHRCILNNFWLQTVS